MNFAGFAGQAFAQHNAPPRGRVATYDGGYIPQVSAGNCSAAENGKVNIEVNAPNGETHFACLNVNVNTNSAYGYSLNLHADSAALIGNPTGTIAATSGTMATPAALNPNTWGFCIPGGIMNVPNGFDTGLTACGGLNGSTATALRYAQVLTTPTLVRLVETQPSTDALQNTPIRFGARPTAALAAGAYAAQVTITASVNLPPPPPLQDGLSCPTERTRVVDARDGRSFGYASYPELAPEGETYAGWRPT